MRRALALLAAAALAAGCGEKAADEAGRAAGAEPASNRLVDVDAQPPLINGLDVDPDTGEYLLTSNKGFWRIDASSDEATRIEGSISSGGTVSTVGTFLFVRAREDGTFIGSGHPDQKTLPEYLGFIESGDGGETWRVIARLGEADLHKIVERHGRMYAWDAVLSAMLISEDGAKTFTENFTPRGLIIDFDVDPDDPQVIVAANEEQIFRTEDAGKAWRPLTGALGARLAWPAADKLYRADSDGTVYVSPDGGLSFDPVGKVEGEPYKIRAFGPDELAIVLADATIVKSTDGGKTWNVDFKP